MEDILEKERNYQRRLLERALKENVILCLPTGAGKTLIAINVIKRMLPAAVKGNKKIVFLASKVHLVHQQGKYIQSQVGYTSEDGVNTVAIITGDLNTDVWKKDKWDEVLGKCHVLVITSEIFKQILILTAFITLEQVALIIFDECHNAVGGDPMSKIIDAYAAKYRITNFPRSNLPRILGLTATILRSAGKLDKVHIDVMNVEDKFCSRVITHVEYAEVLGFSTSARMEIKTYASYDQSPHLEWDYRDLRILDEMKEIIERIDSIRHQNIPDGAINHSSYQHPQQLFYSGKTMDKILKEVLTDVYDAFMDLGPYCARLAAVGNIEYLEVLSELRSHDANAEVLQAIGSVKTALTNFIRNTEAKFEAFEKDLQLKIFISDKLAKLICLLLEWRGTRAGDCDKCGLVFVRKRATAHILHWYFVDARDYIGGKFELLSTDFAFGSSGSRWGLDYDNMHYTAKKQTETMRKFRDKETNLIFTTSVLEEGIDVRNCNLGVRFDRIENYASYVQSMGRVRKPNAPFYVLTDTKRMEVEQAEVRVFEAYNQRLTAYLIQKSMAEDEDGALELGGRYTALELEGFEPFCPEGLPNSPTVTLDTSIQLVYRYCSSLPGDQLAPLTPYSWWKKVGKEYCAYLQFPSNSVIQEILEGPVARQKALAKQAVHLQACRLLYEKEALDQHLLPITIKTPKAAQGFIDNILAEIAEETESGKAKVGSKRRTQWYPKAIPEILLDPPSPTGKLVLYQIQFRASMVGEPSQRSGLYDFENKSYSFGLLVDANISKSLEMIPDFPLFGKSGSKEDQLVMAHLEKLHELEISPQRMEILRLIQHQVFTRLLGLGHPLLFETPIGDAGCFVVIPLIKTDEKQDIWYKSIVNLLSMDMVDFCADPFKFQYSTTGNGFSPGVYEDAVVVSCCQERYESIKLTDLFCVIQVCDTMTSTSICETSKKFPKETYQEYFQAKNQNIKIKNPDFPLLKTKNIGSNLNFLSVKHVGSGKGKRTQNTENYYPPDLVAIFPIPASLFIQARFLPSFLQRIYRLLLSAQIQASVADMFHWSSAGNNNSAQIILGLEPWDDATEENSYDDADAPQVKKLKLLSLGRNQLETRNPLNPLIELEYTHPDKITRGAGVETLRRRMLLAEAGVRPLNFNMNFNILHRAIFSLTALDRIQFNSMDAVPNFEREGGPPISTIAEALTVANAEDVLSMENLEFIGDSVLKLFSSAHVFVHFPRANEGQMTNLRNQLVSNANFYLRGKDKGLGEILAGGIFKPGETWSYPGAKLLGNVASALVRNDTTRLDRLVTIEIEKLGQISAAELDHCLLPFESNTREDEAEKKTKKFVLPDHTTYSHSRFGDKNIADCVEALVGAYFTHGGLSSAARVMAWLGLKAPNAGGEIINYSMPFQLTDGRDLRHNANALAFVDDQIVDVEKLEKTLAHSFKNRLLLLEALSYPNYVNNNITGCYQRLEFLGDAVLDFLIANHIHSEVKVKSPGQLTLLKSALVNNHTLACLSVKYGFYKHLKYTPLASFQNAIDGFVEFQELNGHCASGNGLPLKTSKLWKDPDIAECLTVPKVLGDIFESVIGAIYVDSGFSLDHTWRVIYRLMETEIKSFSENIPKNVLMELYEKFPGERVDFSAVVDDEMNSTLVKLTINSNQFQARGRNKKEAKEAAANWALECIGKVDSH